MTAEQALAEAERLAALREFEVAERVLAQCWSDLWAAPPPALHVMALIRGGQRRFVDAERFLRAAIAAEPLGARHHAALGELLGRLGFAAQAADAFAGALRIDANIPGASLGYAQNCLAAGRCVEAEAALRSLIELEPSAEAWETLSRTLRAQDKLEGAIAAADAALAIAPKNVAAAYSRATALAAAGRNEEALAVFDALGARGVSAPALMFGRGAALFNLTRAADAEASFTEGARKWPGDINLHKALANARWMRGAGETFTRDFEAAIARDPANVPMRLACADLLRRADFRARSEALLREGLLRAPEDAALLGSLGVLLDELDNTADGLPLLLKAKALAPGAIEIRANVACALLRLRRPGEALREIAPARAAQPLNQEWICYETMALRQLGDPRYREICDYDLMVQPYDLAPPAGFSSMESFNEALSASLKRLHVLESHPLDQSLRGGSQTSRSLLYVGDPVIAQYLRALDAPIRAYMDAMGAPDPSHPWSGRKTGDYKLAGAWSVKLKANGYHINHLHPAGWISSAYYVAVPDVVFAGGHQGWIKFGEPRWPTPGCGIEKVVQPKVGRLVLFPSYMWHGTIPFDAGERVTAPFDVVPG